jgi:xanthine dehydrogenase YagT iron-sulfur-binding subunit
MPSSHATPASFRLRRTQPFGESGVAGATVAFDAESDMPYQPIHAAGDEPGDGRFPRVPITLTVNGTPRALEVAPWTALLDLLRDELGLAGSKKGCDHGQCGACTVLLDGKRVNACLVLAASKDGGEVTTIEGLARPDGTLHPLQQAFIEHDAFQCGYCTPGQILSALALLREGRARSRAEIQEFMSGNLCRCGAYPNIVAAIEDAAARGGAAE